MIFCINYRKVKKMDNIEELKKKIAELEDKITDLFMMYEELDERCLKLEEKYEKLYPEEKKTMEEYMDQAMSVFDIHRLGGDR